MIPYLQMSATRAWWRHGGTGPLWQRCFHDRGIRHPDDYERAAIYVLENPVCAGLVTDWPDFPHLGGTLVDDQAS